MKTIAGGAFYYGFGLAAWAAILIWLALPGAVAYLIGLPLYIAALIEAAWLGWIKWHSMQRMKGFRPNEWELSAFREREALEASWTRRGKRL